MPSRLPALLKSLNAHDVRYVVIGAAAFPAHGFARDTFDLDTFFEPTADNAARLRAALAELQYPIEGTPVG